VLYFVDESGIDLKEAPCLVLAGVGVREAKVWPLTRAFIDLRDEILRFPMGQPYEIKGSRLLKRRVFQHAAIRDEMPKAERDKAIDRLIERNARGEHVGGDELAALAQAKLAFVHGALDLAKEFEMTGFASIVPRDAPQQRDASILRKDFAFLLQRFHCHVCDQEDDVHGVLIFDEQDRALSQRLLEQMHRYFSETERGQQRAERMIPMPFFVRSDLTPPIQIADLLPRMTEPVRDELRPFANKVFELRYQGREVLIGKPDRGRKTWGIVYIEDLRPRSERGDYTTAASSQAPPCLVEVHA
jgi:hypothetical protein